MGPEREKKSSKIYVWEWIKTSWSFIQNVARSIKKKSLFFFQNISFVRVLSRPTGLLLRDTANPSQVILKSNDKMKQSKEKATTYIGSFANCTIYDRFRLSVASTLIMIFFWCQLARGTPHFYGVCPFYRREHFLSLTDVLTLWVFWKVT